MKKIEETIATEMFRNQLQRDIDLINDNRQKMMRMLKPNQRLRRTPIDTLTEMGKWNVDGLSELLVGLLRKVSPLPANVRQQVRNVCFRALDRAVSNELKQANTEEQ